MTAPLHILIPFYNAAATLPRTLRSLACIPPEIRSRVTIIGIDDGSTDASPALFDETLTTMNQFSRVLLQKVNGGTASARNMALQCFQNGWTLFLDADDELVANPFPLIDGKDHHSAVLFSTETYKHGRRMTVTRPLMPDPSRFLDQFTERNPFHTSMVLFQRHLLTERFDENLVLLEDWHFWAVNRGLFSNCAAIPSSILARIHVDADNKSANLIRNGEFRVKAADAISRFWGDNLGVQARNNLALQRAIGAVQMAQARNWMALLRFPVSPGLYAKLLVYYFLYPLYTATHPYSR